jgi:hypothetical protein
LWRGSASLSPFTDDGALDNGELSSLKMLEKSVLRVLIEGRVCACFGVSILID